MAKYFRPVKGLIKIDAIRIPPVQLRGIYTLEECQEKKLTNLSIFSHISFNLVLFLLNFFKDKLRNVRAKCSYTFLGILGCSFKNYKRNECFQRLFF